MLHFLLLTEEPQPPGAYWDIPGDIRGERRLSYAPVVAFTFTGAIGPRPSGCVGHQLGNIPPCQPKHAQSWSILKRFSYAPVVVFDINGGFHGQSSNQA